jgi:hypothetical protein
VIWISVVAAGALGVVGVVLALVLSGGTHLSMPESLGGESLVHPSSLDVLVTGMQEQMKKDGAHNAVAGYFGTPAQPKFMLVAFDKSPPPGTEMIKEIAPAFTGGTVFGANGGVDTNSISHRIVGSTRYECAPYSISTTTNSSTNFGTMCLWGDSNTTGIVVTFDPSVDASGLTQMAHEAVLG